MIALLIAVESGLPVFYSQKRLGQDGRTFHIWKFRTMVRNAAEVLERSLASSPELQKEWAENQKLRNDPRITRIGKVLRKASLDELPQLWNVLLGDMSLVGPRPPLPSEVQQYTLAQRRRLEAVPGLTCTWQVSGRCEIPFEKQVELDVEYIESQSVSLDVKLLFQTVSAVFQRRGAY